MKMRTCTWAPTVFAGPQVAPRTASGATSPSTVSFPDSKALHDIVLPRVRDLEALGLTHLLIAQRWWGSGVEMEASSLDCLAMTAVLASHTSQLHLVTAIHPGFFEPTAIAKWGATLDWLSAGRWSINVTSGWNLREFEMYGIDTLEHDERYDRSKEFIDVLRGAWSTSPFTYEGDFYRAHGLQLEPMPEHPIEFFQGGQSSAAIGMAASHSDWMFLNGGDLERIEGVIRNVRSACAETGRNVRFALYAAPVCRESDEEAWDVIHRRVARIDPELAAKRRKATAGAQGMWASDDVLSMLDTNEGYASRLIGSPETILARIDAYRALGVEMLHFDASDEQFNTAVLPQLQA